MPRPTAWSLKVPRNMGTSTSFIGSCHVPFLSSQRCPDQQTPTRWLFTIPRVFLRRQLRHRSLRGLWALAPCVVDTKRARRDLAQGERTRRGPGVRQEVMTEQLSVPTSPLHVAPKMKNQGQVEEPGRTSACTQLQRQKITKVLVLMENRPGIPKRLSTT